MNEILLEERKSVGEYSAWAAFRYIRWYYKDPLHHYIRFELVRQLSPQGFNVELRHRKAAFHIYRFLIEYALECKQKRKRFFYVLFLLDSISRRQQD